ncbi:helix-turn-helix domain-containing protein [Rosistilla oblonga]|uniref:AlbA family DNA-binding domain-containing protein n=1 Tax=Rosistilla oblonga TaxID=2527990 RepID=UPI003A975981
MEIGDIPSTEDDRFEFKSSATPLEKLKQKIERGVCGFANTGGGVFLAGISDKGIIDEGVPIKIGNTSLRDWVDQIVHRIEPFPKYSIDLIEDVSNRGTLLPNRVLLAISVPASVIAPHMASDSKYYIRAGAHTVPARHFIVEGIRSRRNYSHPRLVHRAEVRQLTTSESQCTIELLTITDSPALDVEISIIPTPQNSRARWPRMVPLIDRTHTFKVGFIFPNKGYKFELDVRFTDLAGNSFRYSIDSEATRIHNSHEPLDFRSKQLETIASTLRDIERKIR